MITDQEKEKFESAVMKYGVPIFVIVDLSFFAVLIYGSFMGYSETFIKIFVAISFTAFHGTLRMVVMRIVSLFRPLINPLSHIYEVDKVEIEIYEALNIKKWKDKAPAWDRRHFILSLKDIRNVEKVEQVLRFNIGAELIHYVDFVLSLFGTLFCLFKGMQQWWWVFGLVSLLLGLLADLPFAMIQRYNRYRLLPIYKKLKEKENQ